MQDNKIPGLSVELIMNRSCNLDCKYCIQKMGSGHAQETQPPDRLDDIIDFLKQAEKLADPYLEVRFYGGEPLIGFDKMKKVVERLKKSRGSYCYAITTNGKLLTEEAVDFFNEYDFDVSVSWDGSRSSETRGYDVVKERKNQLAELRHLRIKTVFEKSDSIIERLEEVSEFDNFYFARNGYHMEPAVVIPATESTLEECYQPEVFRSELRAIFEKERDGSASYMEESYLGDLSRRLRLLVDKKPWEEIAPLCVKETSVFVALDGSILRCSNIDDKVATIDEDIRTILRKMKEANTIPLMEKCKTCPYATLNGKGAGCSVDYAISDGASCKICEAYGKVIIEEFCRFSRESCGKEKTKS